MLYQTESLAGEHGHSVGRARDARSAAVATVLQRTGRSLGRGLGRSLGRGLGRLLRPGLRGALATLGRRRQRRIAIRQLQALPDAILNDIGIDRGHIPGIVDNQLDKAAAARPDWPHRCTAAAPMLLSRRPDTGAAWG